MDFALPPKTVRWTDRERLAWHPPENLTVSEWADAHRILHPLTSSEPGKWSTDRTPYLREIMDAFSSTDHRTEQITIMASTQVGKTECLLNMLAFAISQDPSPALFTLPRESDVISIGQRRIKPMIESSPELSKHLSEAKGDNKLKEIRLSRSILYLAGSNSPADLASRPVRYVFGDEVDKWPQFSGREASPIDLMRERTRTYWNRKVVLASTPTTRAGYIFREWERSDQREYHVPCPHCDYRQTLEFSQVKWPDSERDPAIIRQNRLAWYECVNCGEEIGDLDKPKMLKDGEWISKSDSTSAHAGFRIHALYSPWLTFSECAAAFLESKDDPPSLLNFVNSWLGWIWEERSEKIEAEDLAARVKDYERSTVPDGVRVICAGVDVQKDHLYYTIRGFGAREESWLIEAGRLDAGLEQLVQVIVNRVFPGRTKNHRVRLTCIDSGYRTDEVYRFARHHAEVVRPIKGQQKLSGVPIRSNKIDRNVAGDAIRQSIRLWHLDTSHFKDKLTRLMTAQDGEPGAWHLHTDISADYLRQCTSEAKVLNRNRRTGATKTEWARKPGAGANHYWDTEVYCLSAADMLAVYALSDEEPPREEPAPQTRNQQSWVKPTRGDWING